jgi:serine/threonine protein kinase
MIGKTLQERYTLIQSLGSGGMGEVFLAVDSWQYNRQVAIKALKPQLARDAAYLHRFRMEAGILRRLNHPNIVEYIEDFAVDDQHYIVMEYVAGGNLLDFIAATDQMSEETFRQIILGVTDALTRAHDNSIIHRDIKPENILLTPDGVPKVSDFGVAWLLEQPDAENATRFGGSPYYMSPQRWEGGLARQTDDIWSLGVVMYEMLSGEVPFYGTTEMATVHAIWNNPTPDLREIRPDLPHGYAAIIERTLEKSPARRYSLMRKVAADLEAGQPEEGIRRREGRFVVPPRRWPLIVGLGITTIVAVVIGIILLLSREPEPTTIAGVIVATRTPPPTETPLIITATPQEAPVVQESPLPLPTATRFVITSTPLPTDTPPPSATASETSTWTPSPLPTDTLAFTDTPVPSVTPTATASSIPSATPTASLTPTLTATATGTATNTFTPTITSTPRPTLTPSHTPTSTPDLLATQQAEALATLAQVSSEIAPTATPLPSSTPTATATPDRQHWPDSMRVLDDFNAAGDRAGTARWMLPEGWGVISEPDGNLALEASAPGSARRLDAADWGRYYSLQFRFRLGQGGQFSVDLFGDLTRCQATTFTVTEDGVAVRYTNQTSFGGSCRREFIPITIIDEPISGFVWHTLRLEARDSLMLVFLDGVRLNNIRNPLPSTVGPSGMLALPEDAETPVLFDDFVVNLLNPSDTQDLVWRAGDAYCVQDFGAGSTGVALEARIEGDYVDAIWGIGPSDVSQQSYMLYPDPVANTLPDAPSSQPDVSHYTYFEANQALNSGTYALVPLHEGVEVTGRRLITPHRDGYTLPDAPRAMDVALTERGLQLSWQPVQPVEGGFNPGGAYLIRVQPASGAMTTHLFSPLYEDRGAASVPRYLLPWGQLYRPPTASGIALDTLPDGDYLIQVWAVSSRPSSGDECRAIDNRESIRMTISGSQIFLTLRNGTTIGGVIGLPQPGTADAGPQVVSGS